MQDIQNMTAGTTNSVDRMCQDVSVLGEGPSSQ